MTGRPLSPPGLQGERTVLGTPSHGDPPAGLSPISQGHWKRGCRRKTISCQGSFCFLSQTGSGPQKRLTMLPFDPWELGTRPSLTAALRAASPGPRAGTPFPDTEQTSGWLPQTPWHLQRDRVEQGPHSSPCCGRATPENVSEEGVWPPTSFIRGKSKEAATDKGLQDCPGPDRGLPPCSGLPPRWSGRHLPTEVSALAPTML